MIKVSMRWELFKEKLIYQNKDLRHHQQLLTAIL